MHEGRNGTERTREGDVRNRDFLDAVVPWFLLLLFLLGCAAISKHIIWEPPPPDQTTIQTKGRVM